MVKNVKNATLQAVHTVAVVKAVQCQERNVVLDGWPPPNSSSEKELTRKDRSNPCSTKIRILVDSWALTRAESRRMQANNVCADCGTTPHDVKHLFVCPTTLIPSVF